MSKIILISIKPEFVEKIFTGEKTIELRKCKPDANPNDLILIYCTQPIKAIVGLCKVNEIFELKPEHLWNKYFNTLGITENQFQQYYKNSNKSVGISIKEVSQLINIITLKNIRIFYPSFSPPQTFKYFSKTTFIKLFKEYIKSNTFKLE